MCDMQKKVDEIKALPFCRSQQAVELVRRLGMSKAEAARSVGVTTAAVSHYVKRSGIPRGITEAGRAAKAVCAATHLQTEKVRKNRNAAIAASASEYRRKLGLPTPQQLIEARDAGKTYREIAKMFGITRGQASGAIFYHSRR